MVSRFVQILLLVTAVLALTQCGAKRKVASSTSPAMEETVPERAGIAGFRDLCQESDTINTILISKAEALFTSNDERYEAQVSIYSIRDSLIYMSVVNSGFEVIRAAIDTDSIVVIDRLNKIVYTSPVRRRMGFQNPVNFYDIQNLVSRFYLCNEIEEASEIDFSQMGFLFNEPLIKKSIVLNRESLKMDRFEFVHSETKRYFMGERSDGGFMIYSNFMVNEFEVLARQGTLSYNQPLEVKMEVNRRKYSFVNF